MKNAMRIFSEMIHFQQQKRRGEAGRKEGHRNAVEEITLDLSAEEEVLKEYAHEVRTLVDIGYSGSQEIIE